MAVNRHRLTTWLTLHTPPLPFTELHLTSLPFSYFCISLLTPISPPFFSLSSFPPPTYTLIDPWESTSSPLLDKAMLTECEKILGQGLLHLPRKHNYRYGPESEKELLELLFRSLTGHNEQRLRQLFPRGLPTAGPWKLAEAQGAEEGAEYSESARGKRCGHIFRPGEATYHCKTCSTDDTCALCSRCFDSSDHTGHQYHISLSPGNCGCCDCGDEEAWRGPLFCAIHTDTDTGSGKGKGKEYARRPAPADWVDHIRMTISRSLDYFCDIISCSPEQLRMTKTVEGIRQDEVASRLRPGWYGPEGDPDEADPEFAVNVWNDEKHSIVDVISLICRSCHERRSFGDSKANETNDVGRAVVKYSSDVPRLLDVSRILEQTKLTVTIRSARDTFREQMCGTIVEWLADIAGCTVLEDNQILRHVICEEMLSPWRRGSDAHNAGVGIKGIDDQRTADRAMYRAVMVSLLHQGQVVLATDNVDDAEPENDDEDVEEDPPYIDGATPDVDGDEDDAVDDDDDDDVEEMEVIFQHLHEGMDEDGDVAMGNADDDTAHDNPAQRPPTTTTTTTNESRAYSATSQVPIPRTPSGVLNPTPAKAPSYWLVKPSVATTGENVSLYEDLWQRTRLDWMILFDLRLWKKTRTDLRDLYISTVVNVPQFKRVMGIRLSALYTALAELFLIADREPDHSIVNLSLQLLTTPSITEEIVVRGNFLTKVMAILYTFLTTRQVGEPADVNPNARLAFETGSVTNRQVDHFFVDLRYLLQSEYVQRHIRTERQYLPQFLDFVKLSQGICPNVRAVSEHVEYETDAWISASLMMREINRLCRLFCDSFRHPEADAGAYLAGAIKTAAVTAIAHSTGIERHRFSQAEINEYVRFKLLPCFDFEVEQSHHIVRHRVVNFVVDKGNMSFHHALHYTLSWLLECGRGLSSTVMRDILVDAAQTANADFVHDSSLSPDDLLLSMFDYPLRVCAWLAQMKAGMWVRNGLSLRHQMSQYRGVLSRDFAYYRDIFMLQTALVTLDPARVLASIADRFGMVDWIARNYVPRAGFDEAQIVDVAEEFIHLLIILLTRRSNLTAMDDDANRTLARENMKRDLAIVLCFKPLSFSDLSSRLSDRSLDSEMFQDVLDEVANFRAPEGLSDTGTFELKPEYIDLIDPYCVHYTKNQREEAENIYREWMAKKTGKKASDIVYEPRLSPIASGYFCDLSAFTRTLLFAQIVHQCLDYAVSAKNCTPSVPATRIETFLNVVLHLILTATLEDHTEENEESSAPSFVSHALTKARMTGLGNQTIVGLLSGIYLMSEFASCNARIHQIMGRFWKKRPQAAARASVRFHPDMIGNNTPSADTGGVDKELKKKQALERQAKVMAQFQQQQQNFLSKQGGEIDWGVDEDGSDMGSGDEEKTTPAQANGKICKYPSGPCILCQEETGDARFYGIFALVQDSSILRTTCIQDPDWIREALNMPSSLDRSAVHLRPFGVAGENHTTVRKLDSAGEEVISEKISLSKGFDSANTVRGPVITGCGHIMHYSCFEVYYAATRARQHQQIARQHPECLDRYEFVCPLCKALGNAFLPITWKGKEELYPGALATNKSFDQFISGDDVESALAQPLNYTAITESNKLQSQQQYHGVFVDYLTKALIPSLAAKVESSDPLSSQYQPPSPSSSSSSSLRSGVQLHQFARLLLPSGNFARSAAEDSSSSSAATTSSNSNPMMELVRIYERLKGTLASNGISSNFGPVADTFGYEGLMQSDSLVRSLGFSVTAVEIAQRGVESEPGATLLDRIPQLTLTHLRVLAETALTYCAVGCLQKGGSARNRLSHEFLEMHRQKLCQLFIGHSSVGTALAHAAREIKPLLSCDMFVFLAEFSLALLPVCGIELRHIIQLCYVAEIVKVSITYMMWPAGLKEELAQHGDAHYLLNDELSHQNYGCTRQFFNSMVAELRVNMHKCANGQPLSPLVQTGYVKDGEDSVMPGEIIALRRLLSSYTLTFLRKTVILMHVQHGVDFPNTGFTDMDTPELERLATLLKLPTLDEVLASVHDAQQNGSAFGAIISGWIFHTFDWNAWYFDIRHEDYQLGLNLPHPGIFELVGLPKYYDNLIEEANRRRCPTTGKELTDPSICLFCGDIFCSQAYCCGSRSKLGGCTRHLQK